MKKFFEEFKAFAMRGNVIDLAVGVVIGGAFGKITTSIVNDIIMPCISMLTGGINFADWKIVLKEAVANAEGVIDPATEVAIKYGNTIAIILDFIIIALAVFCMVKGLNTLHAKAEAAKKKEEEEAAAAAAAAEAEAAAAAAAVPPAPTAEELLTEIRDLLRQQK